MQLVYMDEAGIANPKHEPFMVVAGVLVNADQKWKALEQHFNELAAEFVPDYEGGKFIFHAKDIWHGEGIYDREKWGNNRWELLKRLAAIPAKFALPIAPGYINREIARANFRRMAPTVDENRIHMWTYMEAFHSSVRRVENWMKKNGSSRDEVAMLIMEDTDRVKGIIKNIHDVYTDRTLKVPNWSDGFQSAHIMDELHFAKKSDSRLLQIADHCAFFIKRRLAKCPKVTELYNAIEPQIFLQPDKNAGVLVTVRKEDIVPVYEEHGLEGEVEDHES